MVKSVSFTPYGGDTIKALEARQKALQQTAPELPGVANMRSPWQGASYLANTLVNTLQQNAAAKQENQARTQLAQMLSGHQEGTDWTNEEFANMGQIDQEFATHLMDLQAARELSAGKENIWKPIAAPPGETGQWYQNQYGDTKKVGGSTDSSAWKPSDIAGRADDYMKAASTYNQAAPSWQSMQEAARTALDPTGTEQGRGAADYNMIVAFAKLLDPNSVVREGEVQSAQMTDGQIGMLEGWLNSWTVNGGSLGDDARRGIMTQANSRMAAYHKQASDYRKWIVDVSTRNKVNPDDVVPPLPDFTPWVEDVAADIAFIPKPEGYTGAWPDNAEVWAQLTPEQKQLFVDAAREAAAPAPGGGQ